MSSQAFKENTNVERPDIYSYQEYKKFLKDYLHYLKITDQSFSIRNLSLQAGVSIGYISTILNSEQDISAKSLEKILPYLRLDKTEANYLGILITITEKSSQEERVEGLKKLQRFQRYSKLNPNEALVSNYFSHWYYIVIREMANLKDFQPMPKWIQEKLNYSVTLSEISKALEFLLNNKLIRINSNGEYSASDDKIMCEGNIYRFILTHFHRETFDLALKAIDMFSREQRSVRGFTMCLNQENYKEAKKIMDEAIEKISNLSEKASGPSSVYHFTLMGYPMTKVEDGE